MSEIWVRSLSACPFSRAIDSRRSFSVFSSATRSFRRALIESSAFVYLKYLRRYSDEKGRCVPTVLPRIYRQISSSKLMLQPPPSKNLLDGRKSRFRSRLFTPPKCNDPQHPSRRLS